MQRIEKQINLAELRSKIQDLINRGELNQAYGILSRRTLNDPSYHEYPWLVKLLKKSISSPIGYRIGILSTFTLEPIKDCIQALTLAQGFDLNFYFGGFQQLEQEIMIPESGLYKHNPQLIVIAWCLQDLSPVLWSSLLDLNEEDIKTEYTRILDRCKILIESCRKNLPQTQLLIHSFVPPENPALGIIDYGHPKGQRQVVESLNEGLRGILRDLEGVYLLDCETIARRSGVAWFDSRHWYSARLPFGPEALVCLAREYSKYIRALDGRTKKVLVLDLDNTLWGGVLGELGIDGIYVGPNYPGNTYVEFQNEIKQLSQRGVVLAINSKNNESDVHEVFEQHKFMILKWDDFTAVRINWQDKVTNMQELSSVLSLGLDSFVFIDDSQFEIEMIRQTLPSVTLVEVPRESSDLPGLLSRLGYFDSVIYSEEDRKRSEFYRISAKQMQLKRTSADLDSFYRSLSMCLTEFDVTDIETPRVAQLTQRTNQFNMTTCRYSESDIERFRQNPDYIIRAYRLEDRFGDNGIISVVIIKKEGRMWLLDTFLMSCRVIGRKIETAILALLIQEAKKDGIKSFISEFRPTKKNAPAENVFLEHGFNKIEEDHSIIKWKMELTDASIKIPEFFVINSTKT